MWILKKYTIRLYTIIFQTPIDMHAALRVFIELIDLQVATRNPEFLGNTHLKVHFAS